MSARERAAAARDAQVEPPFEAQWRTRFEEFADHRDDDAGIAGWTTTGLNARLRRFLGLWRSGEPRCRWLDAGCGAGTYSRVLSADRHEVVGVDYSVPTLRKALTRNIEGASFAIADVRNLPFGGTTFKGVLCFGVTQALDESGPAIEEMARVLQDDGEMWIDGLNRSCLIHVYTTVRRRLSRRPRHLRYESPRGLVALCRANGFDHVELHWMPVLPARAQRLQRLIETRSCVWILKHVPMVGALVSHSFIIRASKNLSADKEKSPASERQPSSAAKGSPRP